MFNQVACMPNLRQSITPRQANYIWPRDRRSAAEKRPPQRMRGSFEIAERVVTVNTELSVVERVRRVILRDW